MNEYFGVTKLNWQSGALHLFSIALFYAFFTLTSSQDVIEGCHFPASEIRPLFFEVASNAPSGTVVVDTIVEPEDANIKIASIKSGNLPNIDYNSSLVLRKAGSQFIVSIAKPLHLPPYPSNISEVYLYVTVVCNKRLYSLITVRVKHRNQFAPQFYGRLPYRINLREDLSVGSIIRTPVLAFDWDPNNKNSVTYKIEQGNEENFFALSNRSQTPVQREQMPSELIEELLPQQYPMMLKMMLLKPLWLMRNNDIIVLNISATDNDEIPRKNYTSLIVEIITTAKPIPIIRPKSQILQEEDETLENEPEHSGSGQEPSENLNYDDIPKTILEYDETILTTVASDIQSTTVANVGIPKFALSLYEFTLPENIQSTNFGVVQCMDQTFVHRLIRYRLLTESAKDIIAIDDQSGALITRHPLDYEHENQHKFQVSCCLFEDSSVCDYANVSLEVIDLNDNGPKFEAQHYTAEIPVDLPLGSPVVTVRAIDEDSADNGKVGYALKNGLGLFEIDPDNGTVRLKAPLSTLTNLSLTVEAYDNGYPVQRNMTEVTVRVHASNPSSPVFDQPRYEVTRFAPVPAGSVLVTLHATDPDPGPDGQIVYQIVRIESVNPKDDLSKFSINTVTGQLSANVRLTEEDQSPTVIVVEAIDKSPDFPRKAEAVVRLTLIAERKEKLSFYPLPKRIFISSSLPAGSVVLRMSTSYTEAPQLFTLRNSSGEEYFQMVGDELQVKKKLKEGVYNVIMRVDAGSAFAEHQLAVVIMTDREKYPVFKQLNYEFQIPDNSTYPVLLHTFDAVVFMGQIEYSIYPSEAVPKGLTIESKSGKLYASESFVDTFSDVQPIFVVVRAANVKFPKYFSDVGVIIRIAGAPEHFHFSQSLYQFIIPANTPAGTLLNGSIVVHNRTAESLEYVIDPPDIISIDANGTLRTLIPFSSTNLSAPIVLTIYAKNGLSEATTKVHLIIESVKTELQFERAYYELLISENEDPGKVIGVVQVVQHYSKHLKNIIYRIIEGNTEELFEITQNGFLIRSENGDLDYEIQDHYNLTVEATHQNAVSARTNVLIKIAESDDIIPSLRSIQFWNLTEGEKSVGSKLLLNGTDIDLRNDSVLSFRLKTSLQSNHFNVTQLTNKSAELILVKALSYAETPQILLEIEVRSDGVYPLSVISTVVVNVAQSKVGNGPVFTNNAYIVNVAPDLPSDAPFLTVEAHPSQQGTNVTYRIVAGSSDMIVVDEQTGELRFTRSLSEWIPGEYKLTVEAFDGYGSSTVEVTVIIPEMTSPQSGQQQETTTVPNNQPPIFDQDSYEFMITDQSVNEIGFVKIVDPDEDDFDVKFEPEEYNELFSYDSQSGAITIAYMPDNGRYEFMITATDNGIPPQTSSANVAVTFDIPQTTSTNSNQVSDFSEITATTTIAGNFETITTTKSSEANEETTKDVVTQITSSSTVAENECTFHPIKSVDEISVSLETVTSTKSIYNIDGLCSCSFGCSYEFEVANEALKDFVKVSSDGKIFVEPDGLNNYIQDNYLDHSGRLPINITIRTGGSKLDFLLYVVFSEEYETPDTKDTAMTSTDWQNSESVPSTVTTTTPNYSETLKFQYNAYKAVTPEGTYKSGTVLSMKPDHIKIAEEYQDKNIFYYIAGDEQNLPFYIRNDTAEVIIFGNVDREHQSLYEFDVIAVDDSVSPSMGKARVTVQILDVNDNSPQFQNPILVVPLSRNTPVGELIAVFKAVDADDGQFGEVRYSLQNHTDIFEISEKTGELRLQKSLQGLEEMVYYTAIIASDLGKPALKSTHNFRLEIFDNRQMGPQFREKRYFANVSHDATAGTVIMQVVAGIGPYKYRLSDSYSGLFEINNTGVIILAGTPLKTEQNRDYLLIVTAADEFGEEATVEVEIYLEGNVVIETTTVSTKAQCKFTSKHYNAEVYENQSERLKILKLSSNCEDENHIYVITQGSGQFEIDAKTGELYVIEPLDREKRSVYFIIVGIVEAKNAPFRMKKQTNSVVELLQDKLKPWQALVTVHVLDENDNEPHFVKQNAEGIYVYSVDWQANLLTPIGRIHAEDSDEKTELRYTITEETKEAAENFMLNETTGVLTLTKSLINTNQDIFHFFVQVSDGAHNVTTSVMIYKLSPEINIVLIAVNKGYQDIEEWVLEKKISEELDINFFILVKQPYVDDQGRVDARRTHLFVYATDDATNVPMKREVLKELLEKSSNNISTLLPNMTVFLPSINSGRILTTAEIILIVFCALLLLTACCILLYIVKFCKRRSRGQVTDSEYMIDSQTAGPRPYNVEEINRKTAQSVLSSRPLPDPYETKESYDAQMRSSSAFSSIVFSGDVQRRPSPFVASPNNNNFSLNKRIGDAYSTAGPRSKNFNGNVEQVHSLVNRQFQERRLYDEQDYHVDEALFPVYRCQGYERP